MKEKALFLNFNCCWCPHFETDLEIMLNLKNKGVEVYSLSCGGLLNGFCISSECGRWHNCDNCKNALNRGLDIIKIPKSHRLKLKSVENISFPLFNNLEELKKYTLNGVNIGFCAVSSYMSVTRDYLFDPTQNKASIDGLLRAAHIVSENLKTGIKKIKPSAVYFLNGRFCEYYPAIEICKQLGIDYYIHERASTCEKYQLLKNDMLHRFSRYQEEIKKCWDSENDLEKKKEIAKRWFKDRRDKLEQGWFSFTKDQKLNELPARFDKNKENIAIFNSSMDEYAAFDDWLNPIDSNDNHIIESVLSHYKNDKNKHFYLRVHPNLKDVDTTQTRVLKELAQKYDDNLTVIWAEESVDSYALMEACVKTIVLISTMGIEATFWGRPVILAGKSFYDNLDCVYSAKDYGTLFNLIDEKLLPKPRKNCYPYSYWLSTYGIQFNHFEPSGLLEGKFLGENVRLKPKNSLRWLLKKIKSKIKSIRF